MASLLRNVASQHVTFTLVSASTGQAVTSASFTGEAWVTVDNTQLAFAGSFTTLGNGQYAYNYTQGETNGVDVGLLITVSGAVPVNLDFHTDLADANNLPSVNVADINGSSTSASNLSNTTGNIGRGTVGSSSSTTSITTSAFSPGGAGIVANQFQGRIVIFDGTTATAALRGQASNITANTSGATPTFTVTALTTAPASGDTFSIQ